MGWAERLRPRQLRYRIVAVFLGLLLLVQLGSLALVSLSIDRSAHTAIETELGTGQRVLDRVLAQNAARLADAARVLAADYGFRAAVASNDEETLVSALENQARRIDARIALFTDARFELKATTQAGAERFLPSLRQMALELGEPGRIVTLDGEAYQLVAVPVKAPAVIGWITLGFPIDEALLGEVRKLSTVDVLLLWRHGASADWEPVRGTIEAAAARALIDPWRQARQQALGRAFADEPVKGNLEFEAAPPSLMVRGQRFMAREQMLAVGGAEGDRMMALMLRSVDEAAEPFARLTAILLGCSVLGIAAFAMGSFATARRITEPLHRLTLSAQRLREGDYEAPIAERGDDEIGALGGAFESMRQAVRQREQEIKRIAYEDRLTRLPNRESFRLHARRAIESARTSGGRFAVLKLELARFEQVNQVLGHRFGDKLLNEVALRLLERGPRDERDMLARIGGDDFALLLAGADARAALDAAERIRRVLEQPIRLDDHTIDLQGNVGIACHPEHGADADGLMGRAELARQEARRRGMGVMLYEAAMDADSAESLSLLGELRHALKHDQLRLYLQPKIALTDGSVVGAEALVRWQHPQRGLVPPMKFIPFAEQTGFIRELTAWMLARGTRMLRELNVEGRRLKLSVNLSTRDLTDPDLPDKLRRMVHTHNVEPRCLCLEITESAIMDDPQRAMQTLEALHQLGFKLSIDDFGTGYSSLAYLKSMPVDELKIDKSFVLNMERDLDDAKIVRSTVDLAHNLGLTVVAEGVETAKAWKLLQSLKCDEAQGYFMAKPMPEALFADWIAQWQSPAVNAVQLDTDFADLAS